MKKHPLTKSKISKVLLVAVLAFVLCALMAVLAGCNDPGATTELGGNLEFVVPEGPADETFGLNGETPTALNLFKYEEYEDGTIRIYFTERFHLLDRALQKDFGMGAGMITDENGTPDLYHTHHHAGWFYKLCSITVHEFPEDAEKLILNYDRKGREFRLEIPLGNGEVTA